MKFFPLIWSGLWRKPARTALLLVSLSVAFLLFGFLQGVDSALRTSSKSSDWTGC